MNQLTRVVLGAAFCIGLVSYQPAFSAPPPQCKTFHIDPSASEPLKTVTLPPIGPCIPRESNGHPLPDPTCSPGAVNPTLTLKVLKTKGFTTKCVREVATSKTEKEQTYKFYGITKPVPNGGQAQTCELDHIISLQLGGADTLENLWPQCGPPGVVLNKRHFKIKDNVEGFLARQIKAGKISLEDAQKGIAEDWTQFLADALAAKSKASRKTSKKKSKRKT
jgi:hypothetical protein